MRLSLSEVENSPQLSQEILPKMMRPLRQAESLMAIAGQLRVEDRLQQLLILLKHEFGQPIEIGTKIIKETGFFGFGDKNPVSRRNRVFQNINTPLLVYD